MLFLFYLISIFGLISCYQASNETTTSKTPQVTNKDSIVENLLIAKFDTILVDSFFMSQGAKTMKIYHHSLKDNCTGFNELECFKILFISNDKVLKRGNYCYIPSITGSSIFLKKIGSDLFVSEGGDGWTPPHLDMYYIVDWKNNNIIIKKEVRVTYDFYGKEEKETTLINKTIDEYEAELKAEFSK